MSDLARSPKYRHYRPKNLAVVRIDGRDVYLGKYNSPENWERYGRVIAEWRARNIVPLSAGGKATPEVEPDGVTVSELILAFWRHAEGYYRRADGSPTGELDNLRLGVDRLQGYYEPVRRPGRPGLSLAGV